MKVIDSLWFTPTEDERARIAEKPRVYERAIDKEKPITYERARPVEKTK